MKAELISVGTEILLGEILNTDAKFLSEELSKLGIDVFYQVTVGDNAGRLKETFLNALDRSDIVIASGGLGPTPDDITKEVISESLGLPLILDEESLCRMKAYFEKSNRSMPDNNIKQAMMPKGSIILQNNNGTAPGCIIEVGSKAVIILPGPPVELTKMFSESVLPYLEKKSNSKLYTKTFHLFGIGESAVAEELSELMEKATNPTVAPYAKTGEVHLRIAAKAENQEKANEIMKGTEELIFERFGEYIYSTDGSSLPEVVIKLLIDKKITISTAESCTGGLIAKTITDFSGVSEIFAEGYVTYANSAKEKLLGVSKETLEKYGAVSSKTAKEMAEGVKKVSGADVGVAVTGIAGPGGGTKEKPVGLVYLAVSGFGKTIVKKLNINGNRERVRYITMLNAFSEIKKVLSH